MNTPRTVGTCSALISLSVCDLGHAIVEFSSAPMIDGIVFVCYCHHFVTCKPNRSFEKVSTCGMLLSNTWFLQCRMRLKSGAPPRLSSLLQPPQWSIMKSDNRLSLSASTVFPGNCAPVAIIISQHYGFEQETRNA